MKPTILLLLLGLLLWNFGGLWFYHQCCCDSPSSGLTNNSSGLIIQDGNYFLAQSEQNIQFEAQKATFEMPDAVRNVFSNTALYLKNHPAKTLEINTITSDLETKRGEAIAQYLRTNNVENYQLLVHQKSNSNLNYTFGCTQPFILNTDGKNLGCNDNFVFKHSDFDFAVPLSGELDDMLAKVATYLKENPDTQLQIDATFSNAENNNSSLPNLGKARANKIRGILLEKYNVSPQQINYDGIAKDNLAFIPNQNFESDLLIGPIQFTFSKKTAQNSTEIDATRIATLEKDLLVNPRLLYFGTGKDNIIIKDEFRVYFEEVIYYLDNVPTAKILCAGHTDDVGEAETNKDLAQRRADFIAQFFASQGIVSTKIKTIAYGEEKPLVAQKDDLGRAKNRRVEILVKKE